MDNFWLNKKNEKNLSHKQADWQELPRAERIADELRAEIRAELEIEFTALLEEGYEEAWQMVLAERKIIESLENKLIAVTEKNAELVRNLEIKLHDEYAEKLAQQKDWIIDKVDQYLTCCRQQAIQPGTPEQIVTRCEESSK